MNINVSNRINSSLPFKGHNKEDKKKDDPFLFIAGSTALGSGIGALSPERLIIKNQNEVTPENLANLIKNPLKYAKQLGSKGAETLQKTLKSTQEALLDFSAIAKGNSSAIGKKVSTILNSEAHTPHKLAKEVASHFEAKGTEEMQGILFEDLKHIVPKESRINSSARGAIIGGSIATGLVVMSKILEQSTPPEEIYSEPWENPYPQSSAKFE